MPDANRTPAQVFVDDFEQYAADARASMDAAEKRHGKGDPVYLILEGVYHDRKSAADQVKGFVNGLIEYAENPEGFGRPSSSLWDKLLEYLKGSSQ